MVSRISLSKGLDVQPTGAPRQEIGSGNPVSSVALSGLEFSGIRARSTVEIGQPVRVGEPLAQDKHNPSVQFTAPGSGRVAAINRGPRRVLQSIAIELDGADDDGVGMSLPARLDGASLRSWLLRSGAWTALRTRPFDKVPDPAASPAAIFITAMDTRPLAADPGVVIARYQDEFFRGLELVARLEEVPVYLCTGPDWKFPEPELARVSRVEFKGPHPAGLPGTHIHFLQPAASARAVWHIDYQQVIAIGRLALTGSIMTERIVALGGPGVREPRLLLTRAGANLTQLLAGELHGETDYQVLSGSVLDGVAADAPLDFLGFNHSQVSVIHDRAGAQLFGWLGPGGLKGSFPFRRSTITASPAEDSNARRGRPGAMLPTERFEQVLPLDLLPAPLLRALLLEDSDEAQALGCLELAAEDLALCSFVCPAKQNYGEALRRTLALIEAAG